MNSGGVEIERQFLVASLPASIQDCETVRISQGYLAVEDDREVRLRRWNDSLILTVKAGMYLVRREKEIFLDPQQFHALWPLTEGRRIEKIRYRIPHGDLWIELDVYSGHLSGFYSAEVEFASKAESVRFIPPFWFGREVTQDERFKNRNLCTGDLPGFTQE
ncbi:MAG: CYTH domain-containing protein [Fibrobacterota bacterium]